MKSVIDVNNKLLQKSVIERISEIEWGNFAANSPYIVELDPTAACDLACPGCISEDVIAAGGRFSNERLLALGDELVEAGVRGVILIGGGEPLAHPAIGKFIKSIGSKDIHIGITTNGTFINRYINEIGEYASWTRVSMDAATQRTFDILRPAKGGSSKFKRIVSNMESLAKNKKGLLGFSFLFQTPADGFGIVDNSGEIYQAAVLAREIGCDYFEVKPTYQFRADVPHALVKHEKKYREKAEEQIRKIQELNSQSFKVYQAINMKACLQGATEKQEKHYNVCPAAYLRTLVTPKGVFVCPYWRAKQEFKLGDVTNNFFSEIWQGKMRKKVMKKLDPAVDCKFHCLRHDSNVKVFEIKRKLDDGEDINTVFDYDHFI